MAGDIGLARAMDVNVVCFVGGKPVAIGEGQSYGLYDLIKPGQFDGILLSADLAHGLSLNELQNFCNYLAPMPIAAFAVPVKGVPSVISDNDGGMRAVMKHLIEVHKYERIAFVRGPVGQVEADARYNAFLDELR